jgi:V8-like Glu-specific endopeptidase
MSPTRRLTGPELLALRNAIVGSLAGPGDLKALVFQALNKRVDTFIDPGALDNRVLELLEYTEAKGQTDVLVAVAVQMSPLNPTLREVADEFDCDDGAGKFERIIRKQFTFADTPDWLQGLVDSMNAVCRIELTGEGGIGTGFLVGPSLVITNHHVTHDDAEVPVPLDQLVFRFDYKRVKGRETEGVPYAAAAGVPLVYDSTTNDFSLIKLKVPAGEQPVAGFESTPQRGWLKPQSRVLAANDPMMIIQHPQATPQKFAQGTITDGAAPANRVLYNVNTDEGSSGSPCFATDWTPVALHHWGGTNHNRGVLFSSILTELKGKVVLGG